MDNFDPLARLGSGNHLDEVRNALIAMSEQVLGYWPAKKGTVTVTYTLSRAQAGDPMVVITDEISAKPPKGDPGSAFYYYVDGGLHREDPRQAAMGALRIVEPMDAPVRTLADAPAQVKEAE